MASIVGALTDIDARRRADAGLVDERARARAYLDMVGSMLVVVRRDGVATLANQAACRVIGRAEAEVVGSDWFGLAIPEETRDSARAFHDDLVGGRSDPSGFRESEILTAAGDRRLVAWRDVVLRDTTGAVVGTLSSGEDVTERRATEDALRESEMLYRAVVENTSDGIVIGRHERALFANTAFARMTGLEPGQIAGFPLISLVEPHERGEVTDRVRRRAAGLPEPAHYDTDLVRQDGSRLSADVKVHGIQFRGEPAILAVLHDITERKEAERQLHRVGVTRDTAERVARVGSWRWDLAAREAAWSPGMYELFDVDPGTPLGDSLDLLAERVPTDEMEMIKAATATAVRDGVGAVPPIEFHVVHRDGSTYLLQAEATTEYDEDGRPAALIGYYRDITEVRAAEQALRESEERHRLLFQESPVPVWEQDFSAALERLRALEREAGAAASVWLPHHPEAVAECASLVRILDVNQASLDFFGIATKQDVSNNLSDYFVEESPGPFGDQLCALAAGKTSVEAAIPIRDLDGGRVFLRVFLRVVPGHEDRMDRVLISVIDITQSEQAKAEIHRLNEELRQRVSSRTEQLEAATRELEALAYSIAHDVRAPLRTIDGFSAAVLEDEGDAMSDEGRASLERVRKAAQTLARLLDDLTGMSRVSRRELSRQPVDLTETAEDVGRELAAENPGRSVELTVAPGLTADADPMVARIILRELLGNAWKFSAGREVAHVEVGTAGTGDDERAFFVRDDGAGFDMRYAGHLFGVFQRMHPPGEYEGDGVGLAMVQRLVRRHGGRCWAEAEPGAGATFFFTLPSRE